MLKNIFLNFSIRTKLIFLISLSAGFALLFATTSSLVYNMYIDKNRIVKESIKLAKVSGKNIAASLMFVDKDSANSILQPILNDENICLIKIYDIQGNPFTTIGKINLEFSNWFKEDFANYQEVNVSITVDNIDVLTSIIHNDEKIGFLQIQHMWLILHFILPVGQLNGRPIAKQGH